MSAHEAIPDPTKGAPQTQLPAVRPARKAGWWWAASVAILLAPHLVGPTLGNYWVRVMDLAALYVMLALGLNIVVGQAGLINFGYVAFYAVGAYAMAFLASPHFHLDLAFWVVLPIAGVAAALFGLLLGLPVMRLRGDYLAMVTLASAEILRIFLNNLDTPINITNGPKGISQISPPYIFGQSLRSSFDLFGIDFSGAYTLWYMTIALALLTAWWCRRLQDSRIGLALAAIREDELAAKASGIDVTRLKLYAFGAGAFFAGVGGCVFASYQAYVSPDSFTMNESFAVLCMVVLGGIGSLTGVTVGAVVLTFLPEVLRGSNDLQQMLFSHVFVNGNDLRMALYSAVMMAFIIYRPQGLLGKREGKGEAPAKAPTDQVGRQPT